MATTKIRGNTQIIAATITNAEINASAAIATTKLADSGNFILKGGSVAFTADQSLGGFKLTNLGAPSSSGDATTKTYVDDAIATAAVGTSNRARVRAATTADITIATALNDADTLDGVTLATGDLVLVKDQSTTNQNGIYVVGPSPARSAQFDTYNEHPGSLIGVSEGTANADTLWFCTSNDGGTLNTTAIAFTKLGIGSDDLKANVASPTFTGVPAAPTAAADTNTTQLATTAYVIAQAYAKLASPTFTGTPTLPTGTIATTQSASNNSTAVATTAYVDTADALKANLASPTFTGTVTAPAVILSSETASTIASFDGSKNIKSLATATYPSLAELAYVKGVTSAVQTQMDAKAPLASPTFTGTVTSPAVILSSETASTIASFDGSKNIKSLATATYPSLTELSYVKGVTSAIQTQIDALTGASGVPLASFVFRETPNETPNSSITAFTVDNAMEAGTEQVYLNGILQEPGGEDYTLTDTTTVTFASAPDTGARIRISYIKA